MSAEQPGRGAVTPMKDFPLAPRDTPWDGDRAETAIRAATGAEDAFQLFLSLFGGGRGES